MSLLAARDITMSYGEAVILHSCSLEVEEGKSVVVTGPSGTGKSTLLSIMGLLLEPTSGAVLLDGLDVLPIGDDERCAIRNESFGFVFQSTQLIGTLTALENVCIPAFLCGKAGLESYARSLLCDMGLEDWMRHYPHQLSVGQQRRVSLARALLLRPRVVFADEPTNDLDRENAAAVGDLLFDLPKRGASLVLVTHDVELARRADVAYELSGKTLVKRR